jgi:hypothetical protein
VACLGVRIHQVLKEKAVALDFTLCLSLQLAEEVGC